MKRVRGKQAARVGFGGPTNKEGFFVALAKPPVKEIGASGPGAIRWCASFAVR